MAVTVSNETGNKIIAACTFYGIFARCIDLGDPNYIGIVKTCTEVVKEAGESRVSMRLMHRDDTSIGRLPRSFQHGGNLNRVVAIVIDDSDRPPGDRPLAQGLHTPIKASERGDRFGDTVPGRAQSSCRDRGNRGVAAQINKRLAKAELTDEQKAKIKELVAAHAPKIQEAQKKIGLSADARKARAAASKKAREEGKKGQELAAAVDAASPLTEDQKAAMKAANEARNALMAAIAEVLTDDQKKKAGLARQKKGGKKKKKKDSE